MSRTLYMAAAAAMFASVTAFAQTPATAPDASAPAASAPASDASTSADSQDGKMHHHHHHHGMRSAKNGGDGSSTDQDADKLNACMSNATPTDSQESCLKQAEGNS